MIPDAVLSCSYLLLGSGTCIYRLVNYSYKQFSQAQPQFIFASIGITAIGIRSIFGLAYNLFRRHYPIDPLMIEQELLTKKKDKHLIDWCLCTIGLSSIIHAFYLQYNCIITGTVVFTSIILLEIVIFIKQELSGYTMCANLTENLITWTNSRSLIPYMKLKYLTYVWVITTELFGLIVCNNFICMSIIPYSLTMIVYRPFGLCHEWSIRNSMNDYMMLTYIILITEALFQYP